MSHMVVVNDEEQFSTWPADRPLPGGWADTGVHGSEEECLDHIGEVWTDIRPKSLRERLAAATQDRPVLIPAGPGLLLRSVSPDEARLLVEGRPAEGVLFGVGYPVPDGTAAAASMLIGAAEQGLDRPGFGMYQILRGADSEAVGDIGFHGPPDERGWVEIGFGLAESARGKGYATVALRALTDWALTHPEITEVRAECEVGHLKSGNVMRRAGFAELEPEHGHERFVSRAPE